MTRSEALAPLNTIEGRFNLTAGAMYRGEIRRAAIRFGIDFYEEKGFFESVFVFRGDRARVSKFYRILRDNLPND